MSSGRPPRGGARRSQQRTVTLSDHGGGGDSTADDTYGDDTTYDQSTYTGTYESNTSASASDGETDIIGTDSPSVETDYDSPRTGLAVPGSGSGSGTFPGGVRRFRGLSTSISDLFLDESLVCGAVSCFGVFLSHRSEHLLAVRAGTRGLAKGAPGRRPGRAPAPRVSSRILGFALALALAGTSFTYAYWGFGSGYGEGGGGGISSLFDFGYDDDAGGYYYSNDDGGGSSSSSYSNGGWDASYTNNGGYNYSNDDGGSSYSNDDGGGSYSNDDASSYGGTDDAYYGNRGLAEGPPSGRGRAPGGIRQVRDAYVRLWVALCCDGEGRQLGSGSGSSGSGSDGRWVRFGLAIFFLTVLGVIGRRRRARARYEIVKARAQDDRLYDAGDDVASMASDVGDEFRERQYEGACGHTLLGCYPTDEIPDVDGDEGDYEAGCYGISRRRRRRGADCMVNLFSCVSSCCCGLVCNFWFQCFSICALAQEGREIRLLLPPKQQRIDLITHQPFHEYYKAIYDLRLQWMAKNRDRKVGARSVGLGSAPHLRALSDLSRYILLTAAIATVVIVLVLSFNPRASFDWGDGFVLVATFGQSFVILYIVHWMFHKSDLSFDAVVKFFASGFLVAMPTAFVFELILTSIILSFAYIVYEIYAVVYEDSFLAWVGQHYTALWMAAELVNAFVIAAVVEETCKYYAFRFIEHPDLIFLTGLDRAKQDERALRGGARNYAFSSKIVAEHSSPTHRLGTGSQADFDDDLSIASGHSPQAAPHRSKHSHQLSLSASLNGADPDEPVDLRTLRQRAAAITTAMIGTAMGLACAENFIYVFFGADSNSGTSEEIAILIFRSLFPVHALTAAMQSIGVIRKFLEVQDGHGDVGHFGLGKIILPAVLLHGAFDAVLMSISVYIESSWDEYLRANNGNMPEDGWVPYNAFVINLCAWILICGTMAVGITWYAVQNRKQKARLEIMEDEARGAALEMGGFGTIGSNSRSFGGSRSFGNRRPRSYVSPSVGGPGFT